MDTEKPNTQSSSLGWIMAILTVIGFSWYIYSSKSPSPKTTIQPTTSQFVRTDDWDCTYDCSGHEAGYNWAEENGITDPDDCGGNSQSFTEGCESYANEYQQENYDLEYQDDYEDYPY